MVSNPQTLLHKLNSVVYNVDMTRYKIEVMETGKQIPYEGAIQDRLHVMQELAYRFKSNIRLWASTPVDDGNGCVDFEVEIIHEVKYIERPNYAQAK